MNTQSLLNLGIPRGEAVQFAKKFIHLFISAGGASGELEDEILKIVATPELYLSDELRAPLAHALFCPAFIPRPEAAPWRQWGVDLEADAVR